MTTLAARGGRQAFAVGGLALVCATALTGAGFATAPTAVLDPCLGRVAQA
jgi:hypothetical protein